MRSSALALLALASGGCATVAPLDDATQLDNLEGDEKRIWAMSDEVDESLRKSGALYHDPQLREYLQELTEQLFPEFGQAITVRLLKNADANAFAMANGSVYVNNGMLARLRDEAELASILGHEGAHFTERHVIESVRNAKGLSMFASVVGAATGLGGAVASSLLAASSMSSISQSNETEADIVGMQRMVALGYAPTAAAGPFERLAAEIKARDIDEPIMFRSHPKLSDRAASLTALARGRSDGVTNRDRFLARAGSARLAALEQAAERRQGELLIFLLDSEAQRESYAGAAEFYLAEGYRIRGKEGDLDKAKTFYRQSIALRPTYAPAYGKLGYLYMKEGESARAIEYFEKFQEHDLGSPDSAYIASYLKTLKQAPK